MHEKKRFLISYIRDNQPNTLEISCERETLDIDSAKEYIKSANPSRNSPISDVQIVSLHRPNNPQVHPGHYQQPEG